MTAELSLGMPAHRVTSGDVQLRDGLAALLNECRAQAAKRAALPAPHLDANGDVMEGERVAYDDARIAGAIGAVDWLDNLIARLERLAAEPPRFVYTLVFGGVGDTLGSFTVYGADVDDAVNTLRGLPTFVRWSGNQVAPAGPRETGTVIEFHGEWVHPLLPAPGHRYDLRAEQAAPAADRRPAPASGQPTPPSAASAPPHRR